MPDTSELANKTCEPCQGGMAPLTAERAEKILGDLHDQWTISPDGVNLTRRLEFKGFAKAVYHANLVAWLADQEGHHPDVAFGWGYCEITFTTHEAGGLTDNDFICAAKFDRLIASA